MRNPLRFPKNNPAQAIRARHTLMAAMSYLTIISFVLYCSAAGLFRLPLSTTFSFAVLAMAINLLFYAAICNDWNLRLKDPSMTLAQITISTLWLMFVLYFIEEVRGATLVLFLITFVFGIFRLRMAQFVGSAVFALAGYAVVICTLAWQRPQQTDLQTEVLHWVLLAMVLPWFAVIGAYINGIRNTLRQKNRDLENALATIERLATHDELTGIYNRRFFLDALRHEKLRHEREQKPFCLALLDLDFFKNVNDSYGHLAGDEVLRKFAECVMVDVRQSDYFARYGGEEFALLLIDTDLEEASRILERIRTRVATQAFDGIDIPVTVSIGIARHAPQEEIADTLSRADRALYAAKDGGRNQVRIAA